MKLMKVVVFTILLCSAVSAKPKAHHSSSSAPVRAENRTAFFGEDVEILTSSLSAAVVLFKPSSPPAASEVVLMKNGKLNSTRAMVDSRSHLILENVGEEDEGLYIIKYTDDPKHVRHLNLIVRDCPNEHHVKYGETFNIPVHDVSGPITLEFRPSIMEMNASAGQMVVLLNRSWTPVGEYKARLSASERRVSLHGVSRSDEGSYAVYDSEKKLKKKMCLNVREHQHFPDLEYGKTLKINLYLNRTKVNIFYTPDNDPKPRLILDHGELVVPMDPSIDGRLSVEGSVCILERVRVSDKGVFRVTDLEGFPVSNVYLKVQPYKFPSLYVAIISLLSLLAFLFCVCLVSCMVKVRRRAEKARTIAKIARNAGKEEGDAFRQVVHEAYARFTEESSLQSQWDSITQKTEVNIKGLEISRAGQYKPLSPDKNNMETSDSGVEFNTAGLPLDSDTDMPPTYASHKFLLDSDFLNSTTGPEVITAGQTPDSKQSTNPTPDSKLSGNVTPELLGGTTPDGDLMSHTVPEPAPRVADPSPIASPAAVHNGDSAPASEVTPSTCLVPDVGQDAVVPNDKTVTPDQGDTAENSAT
ncbi:uncharacterized protein LOC108922132 [Scleropages formosus]|uniref:Si:dkeyp-77h1.4 n=1 Tax=Scleropages formosus TaxID=113540 RepID=A0A8C9VLM8_SCLFO|nr:uncharacterized protein LOC108922132 [Scleropages formosus]